MRTISHQGKALALIFGPDENDGSNPLTEQNLGLQIMSLKYKKGHVWPAHRHVPKERVTRQLLEANMVMKGAVRIGLYVDGQRVAQEILRAGEGFMVLNHSTTALEMEVLE